MNATLAYHMNFPEDYWAQHGMINVKALKRLHKRKLYYSGLEHMTLGKSFNFLGLSFLISKMKDLEKIVSKAPISS